MRRLLTRLVNNRIPEMLLLFLLGMTPLLWFKPGSLILDPDANFGLDPLKRFFDRLYAWDYTFLSGTDRSLNFSTILHSGLEAAFSQVFDLPTTERLSYVALFILPGFSMYFLVSQISRGNRWTRVASTVAALFFMFNFYQAYIWPRLELGASALIITPVILGMLIRWFRNEINLPRDLLVLSCVTLLSAPIGLQPPFIGTLLIIVFTYFIFHHIIERKKAREWVLSFSRLMLILFVFILCSAFWLIPVCNFAVQSGYLNEQTGQDVFKTAFLVDWTSHITNFVNVFRFQGDVTWFDSWGGQPYSPWFSQYQTNVFLIALGFLFPILAFSALFRKDKFALFFAIISAVGIMMGMGTHPPFTAVFMWLYDNIPGFWIYRAPWQKFTILYVIGFSVLIGITCSKVYDWLAQSLRRRKLITLQKYAPPLLITSIVLLNFFYMWPFITGKTFPSSEGDYGYHEYFNIGYQHKTIPTYLFESANWVNRQDEKFNILLLPDDRVGVYNWGYASIGDVTPMIFNKGVLMRQYGEGMAPPNSVETIYTSSVDNIYESKQTNVAKILGFINTRYILERNDFKYDFYGDTDSPSFIREQLSTQEGIKLERSIGEWDFYRITDENFVPHIYSATKAVVSTGGIDDMLQIVGSETFQPSGSIILLSEQTGNNQIDYSASKVAGSIILKSEQTESSPMSNLETSVIKSENGSVKSFSWDSLLSNSIEARYYEGWKPVIKTDGTEKTDTISFDSPDICPYQFPAFEGKVDKLWQAFDSTLLFIKTGEQPLTINAIKENGTDVSDVIGIWWETGYMGMSTKPISYPVTIPPNEKAIVQINHEASQWTIESPVQPSSIAVLSNPTRISPEITFKEINPTEYKVQINASQPFWLVFSEPYNQQWKAYVDNKPFNLNNLIATYDNLKVREMKHDQIFNPLSISYLFKKSLPNNQHFTANGYANAWYIDPGQIAKDKDGTFTVTLYFWPQSLFYLGLGISGLTLLILIGWMFWKRRQQRLVRHIPRSSPDKEGEMIQMDGDLENGR